MNRLDFSRAGKYPLETDTLDFMQEAYALFNAYGGSIGNYTIISGCETTGQQVSDGFIYLNGELLPFKGGIVQSTIIIASEKIRKEFKNGQRHEVFERRYARFGTSISSSVEWSLFSKPKTLKEVTAVQDQKAPQSSLDELSAQIDGINRRLAIFQSGGAMVLWNKPANQIPEGWQEVADWRGRIPVGFDPSQDEFDSIGKIGGNKTSQATSVIPIDGYGNGESTNGGVQARLLVSSGQQETDEFLESIRKASTNVDVTTTSEDFSVLNPYRTVLFIEYVG